MLRRGGAETRIEKRGPDWYRVEGPKIDKARVDDLVAAIRGARAREATAYGADSTTALERPRVVLTVRTHGKPDQTLAIGAERREGAELVGAYARFDGRAVTYVVEQSLVDELAKLELE